MPYISQNYLYTLFVFSLGYASAQRLGEEGATVLITSNMEKDNDEAVQSSKNLVLMQVAHSVMFQREMIIKT